MNYELSLPYSMSCRIHCNGTYRCLLLIYPRLVAGYAIPCLDARQWQLKLLMYELMFYMLGQERSLVYYEV